MKRELLLSVFLVAILSVFVACSNEASEKQQEESQAQLDETVIEEEEGFDFFLPSSIQIAHILKKSGVVYEQGLTNDPAKSSTYQTRTMRLLNLGAYTGDLAYCILNNQNEMGLKYVAALKQLGNDLDLSEVYQTSEALEKIESQDEHVE